MKFSGFYGLRARLALLIVVALVLLLGLTYRTFLEERDAVLAHVQDDVQRIAQFAAGNQMQQIEATRQLLIGLARLPELRGPEPAACRSLLSEVLGVHARYANLGVILPDGDLFCSAVSVPQPINFGDQPWFRRTVDLRDFAMGPSQMGSSPGRVTLNISTPVLDSRGRVRSVVFAALDLREISQLSSQIMLPKDAEFVMVAENGLVLASLPVPERWSGESATGAPLLRDILKRGRGVAETEGLDGVTRLYAFTPLCSTVNTGIFVSIGMPLSIAYGIAGKVLPRHFVGIALVILMALGAVWLGGSVLFLRPMNALLGAALRLTRGEMGARTGLHYGRSELGRLARAFDEMAEALERQALELRRAEAQYRTLVEQMPVITYTARLDERRTLLYISPQIQKALGFTPEEWMADSGFWMNRIHPDDRQNVQTALSHCLSMAGRTELISEYRLLSADGRFLWFSDEARIVRDESGGFACLQGIMRDITVHHEAEEKLALYQKQLRSLASQLSLAEEQERRRIAAELHDRVAQTLAISKIRLGMVKEMAPSEGLADSISDIRSLIEQAIRDTRSLMFRISSPILYELGLEAALEWLTEQLEKENGIRSSFENDDAPKPLDEDIRVLLFQTVSELLVNVVKHARADTVTVSARRFGECIRVVVEDNGAGFDVSKIGSRWTKTEGFGLFSIRERLNHVAGQLEIESAPGRGTRVTLTAPLQSGEPDGKNRGVQSNAGSGSATP